MCRAAPRFGNDLARHEKAKLDPNAGESDAFAAPLRACRHIVVACQLSALHASAVVDDRQCRIDCVGQEANAGRTRVKRIRDHFGEDRLFEGPGVGIPQVFEEVLEVDSGFTHVGILSCGRFCATHRSPMRHSVSGAGLECRPRRRQALKPLTSTVIEIALWSR